MLPSTSPDATRETCPGHDLQPYPWQGQVRPSTYRSVPVHLCKWASLSSPVFGPSRSDVKQIGLLRPCAVPVFKKLDFGPVVAPKPARSLPFTTPCPSTRWALSWARLKAWWHGQRSPCMSSPPPPTSKRPPVPVRTRRNAPTRRNRFRPNTRRNEPRTRFGNSCVGLLPRDRTVIPMHDRTAGQADACTKKEAGACLKKAGLRWWKKRPTSVNPHCLKIQAPSQIDALTPQVPGPKRTNMGKPSNKPKRMPLKDDMPHQHLSHPFLLTNPISLIRLVFVFTAHGCLTMLN